MTKILNYQDTATFVSVSPTGYKGAVTVVEQVLVPVIFAQSTGRTRTGFQDAVESDAVCYPDFNNAFIANHHNRLEGMYVIMQLFGSSEPVSYYRVAKCTVNRDHLLGNSIDNIELLLKKSAPLPDVS